MYDNYIRAADVIDWACQVGLSRAFNSTGGDRSKLADQGDALLQALREDWDRGRHGDDPKRDTWEGREGTQHIIAQVDRAIHQLRTGDAAKTEPFK